MSLTVDGTMMEPAGEERRSGRRSSRRAAIEGQERRRDKMAEADEHIPDGSDDEKPMKRKKRFEGQLDVLSSTQSKSWPPASLPPPRLLTGTESHELLMYQQLLDALESNSFTGARWALHTLLQLSASGTSVGGGDFKIARCPDLLDCLVDEIADYLRAPDAAIFSDTAYKEEQGRRANAAAQIIRNLSTPEKVPSGFDNQATLLQHHYILPTLTALAMRAPTLATLNATTAPEDKWTLFSDPETQEDEDYGTHRF